jgi:DHA2 family multidrug resistance protein
VNLAASGAAEHAGAQHRVFITISVMLASIMQALDNTIANVALPSIQGSLSSTQDQISWVLTSYIIAAAIMTPLSGWLAGQIGRQRVFLFSIVGFTVASPCAEWLNRCRRSSPRACSRACAAPR